MNFLKSSAPSFITFAKKAVILFLLLSISQTSFSQQIDSTKIRTNFNGAVTVTNNGISLVPTFTLGKPATIFDFSVSKNRLSFEPQLAFALEDTKPWYFLFWVRYKLLQNDKFNFNIGVHPSFVFQTTAITANGTVKDTITTKRYWAGELSPSYAISKNVSVGFYYLFGRGVDADAAKDTHFLALNTNFSNIKLSNEYFLRFTPQIFYLNIDGTDGFYATETLTLAKKNFPFTISSIATKTIQSNITNKDFVWNFSLTFSY